MKKGEITVFVISRDDATDAQPRYESVLSIATERMTCPSDEATRCDAAHPLRRRVQKKLR